MLLVLMLSMSVGQQAPSAGAEPAGGSVQRWSILADPCTGRIVRPDEVVVCGQRDGTQAARLPLPEERGPPDRPMPGNPNISGAGALAMASAPCATRSEGCTVGVDVLGGGTALIRLAGKLIDPDSCCDRPGQGTDPVMLVSDLGSAVGRAFKKKPDKSKRVAIPLDDLPTVAPAPTLASPATPVP